MKKILWIFLLAFLTYPVRGIVKIAPVEVGDKPGVSGNVAGSFVSQTGNTEEDEADLSGRLQYDSNENYVAFIDGAYEYTLASDIKTEDEVYSHARYLHKLNAETLYGELFLQYRSDEFKGIDARWLAGGNLRWRFASNEKWGKLYVGLGAFQEKVDYIGSVPDSDESFTRVNSYLAYTNELTERIDFNMVGYYQPAFEDFDDFYSIGTAELNIDLVSNLSLSLLYELEYDSSPPIGIEKKDREFRTAFVWEF
jgi:hypothetical protein